jgi:hypothetical protein
VTGLLLALRHDPASERLSALAEAVYPELKRLAVGLMRRELPGHTLQPTVLVHEAFRRRGTIRSSAPCEGGDRIRADL